MNASEIKGKTYQTGFCMMMQEGLELSSYEWIKELSNTCETFILGIPDDWVAARLYGDNTAYSATETERFLKESGVASKIIILDEARLNYTKIYEETPFDVCFYGSEYGKTFEKDQAFMSEHNIAFISTIPNRRIQENRGSALEIALEDVQREQKIILFGTGKYFDTYMQVYGAKYRPAYAIDNDSAKWNTEKSGVAIKNPKELLMEKAEDVLVVICSREYTEMLEQLKKLGNFNYRTLLYHNQIALLEEFGISSSEERDYLRKSHEYLTILMKEFDQVCQENGLHYYIICGSLIGVIRHKGMIPWDDDIDLAMPRADFEKLKRIARKRWAKDNKIFRYMDYDGIGGGAFLDCMPRLFYMKEHLPTKCFDKVHGKATADVEDRMFLDIYVMDNAHENDKVHNLTINAMKGIYNLMMGHRAFIDYDEYTNVVPEKTIKLMKFIHKVGRMLPIHFMAFMYDTLSKSGNWNKKAKDCIMNSCAIRCIELKYPREHFGEGIRLPFESIEVMVPTDYDRQLQAMRYRNYMEFPRLSIRKPSHYFNSDIEIL